MSLCPQLHNRYYAVAIAFLRWGRAGRCWRFCAILDSENNLVSVSDADRLAIVSLDLSRWARLVA